MIIKKCLILPAVFALSACTNPQTNLLPTPSKSEFFNTLGGGFINDSKSLKYALTVNITKPVNGTDSWFAVVEYENPSDISTPLTSTQEVKESEKRISFISPAMTAIRNHKTYTAVVKVYTNRELKQLITTHSMQVRFDVPDSVLPMMGIKPL